MTNQSHTELAARAKKRADELDSMSQNGVQSATSELLNQLAAALESPERVHDEIAMLRAQLANARDRIERSHQILTGIYQLLDPMCVQADGKTWVFKNPNAQEVLRLLSERIRAVPDQIDITPPTAPAQDARWWSPPDSFAKNWLTNGAALHPLTINLVVRFARALAAKLAAAEVKYGYSDGWRSADWMDECRAKLAEHVAKGDPRDVAAYCAFLWHHGESTAATPSTQSSEGGTEVSALKAYLKECDECCIVPDVGGAFAYAWRAALRASSPADTREPLTDEQIEPLFKARAAMMTVGIRDDWYWYAWGVEDGERAHGIVTKESK